MDKSFGSYGVWDKVDSSHAENNDIAEVLDDHWEKVSQLTVEFPKFNRWYV